MPYFTMADLAGTTIVNMDTGETLTGESYSDADSRAHQKGWTYWKAITELTSDEKQRLWPGPSEPDPTSPGGSESPGAEESWWREHAGDLFSLITPLFPGGDEDRDSYSGQQPPPGGGGRPPMRAGMSPGVKNMLIITGSVAVLGGLIFFLTKD